MATHCYTCGSCVKNEWSLKCSVHEAKKRAIETKIWDEVRAERDAKDLEEEKMWANMTAGERGL